MASSNSPSTIERVLEQQGRQLTWLAKKANVSLSYASLMIAGKRPATAEFRRVAAEALGVPEDVLFAEGAEEPDQAVSA